MEAINVAIPNTSKQKMEAIVALSKAVERIAKALASVSTEVVISNNVISGAETGISIHTEEDDKQASESLRPWE